MFKIGYDAGHGLNTAGKRVPKQLDKNETREWTLNDRVARHFAAAAAEYENVELLRCDDPTGKTDVSLAARCKKANSWGADVYISMHHNAGIKLGSGGGIVAYAYKTGTKGAEYRDEIYKACIAAGGLKGNRSNPTPEKGFYMVKNTKAPAALIEYGFMDSKTDAPFILQDTYSKLVAYATMSAIAKVAGLKKKQQAEQKPEQKPAANKDTATKAVKAKDSAKSFLKDIAGSYKVTADSLNVRHGAGVTKSKMTAIPRGTAVKCYGYYSTSLGVKWLYIQFTYKGVQYTGFASSKYLKKV